MQSQFILESKQEALGGFREQFNALLDTCGLVQEDREDLALAVDEALTNCMEHGYENGPGKIEVQVANLGDRLEVKIKDFGKNFDPTTLPEPELPPIRVGGLGVHFIKSTMDKVEYRRTPDEANELTLTKLKSNPE